MAKNVLVIKGANFSVNKLTTVILDGGSDIPCTGITLNETSKTVTTLGNFTLTATLSPSDTTDTLLWSTSDSSVVTVSSGVVSVVGLGTATITATCGTHTATCTVIANELEIPVDYGFFEWQNLSSYPNMYGYKTSKRKLLVHSLTGNKTLKNQTSDSTLRYPIKVPSNANVVLVSYGSDMRAGTIDFGWLDSGNSAYPSQYPTVAELVSLDQTNSTTYNVATTWTYTKPDGADSFVVTLVTNSADFAESDTPEGIATAKEISIKCRTVE